MNAGCLPAAPPCPAQAASTPLTSPCPLLPRPPAGHRRSVRLCCRRGAVQPRLLGVCQRHRHRHRRRRGAGRGRRERRGGGGQQVLPQPGAFRLAVLLWVDGLAAAEGPGPAAVSAFAPHRPPCSPSCSPTRALPPPLNSSLSPCAGQGHRRLPGHLQGHCHRHRLGCRQRVRLGRRLRLRLHLRHCHRRGGLQRGEGGCWACWGSGWLASRAACVPPLQERPLPLRPLCQPHTSPAACLPRCPSCAAQAEATASAYAEAFAAIQSCSGAAAGAGGGATGTTGPTPPAPPAPPTPPSQGGQQGASNLPRCSGVIQGQCCTKGQDRCLCAGNLCSFGKVRVGAGREVAGGFSDLAACPPRTKAVPLRDALCCRPSELQAQSNPLVYGPVVGGNVVNSGRCRCQ